MTEPLWTSADVATYMRVDPSTVRHWRAAGTGPSYIPGRRVLYRPEDVRRWADRQVVRAASARIGRRAS